MFTRVLQASQAARALELSSGFKSHTRKTARFAVQMPAVLRVMASRAAATYHPRARQHPTLRACSPRAHHLTFTADRRHFALMDRQVGHVGRSTTRAVGVPEGQHSKTAHPRCCGGGRDRTGLVNGYRMRGSAGHWDEPGRASHEDRGEHADQGEQDGDAHPQVVARGQCLRGCVVSERASRVATTPDRMAKPVSPPICWDVVISPEKCPRTRAVAAAYICAKLMP